MWQGTISLRYVSYKNADSNLHERICAMAMMAKNLLWSCAQIVAPRPPINPQRPNQAMERTADRRQDVFADDFQGTSPTGRRYGKEEAITTDTKSLSRDCQLGEVKVRFFGDSIAIAYGAENSMIKDNNGKETKSCWVWTDTWLKRAGKWQIVAEQDHLVPCNPQAVLRALDYRLLARSVTQESLNTLV